MFSGLNSGLIGGGDRVAGPQPGPRRRGSAAGGGGGAPRGAERVHPREGEAGAGAGDGAAEGSRVGRRRGISFDFGFSLLLVLVVGHHGLGQAVRRRGRRGVGAGPRGLRRRRRRQEPRGGRVLRMPLLRADPKGEPAVPAMRRARRSAADSGPNAGAAQEETTHRPQFSAYRPLAP